MQQGILLYMDRRHCIDQISHPVYIILQSPVIEMILFRIIQPFGFEDTVTVICQCLSLQHNTYSPALICRYDIPSNDICVINRFFVHFFIQTVPVAELQHTAPFLIQFYLHLDFLHIFHGSITQVTLIAQDSHTGNCKS